MFIANVEGQAIVVFSLEQSPFEEVFEIDAIPEGSGMLKTDGKTVWWEPMPGSVPTPVDPIEVLQAENKLLTAQIQAQTERADFVEDCLAEMASLVYI